VPVIETKEIPFKHIRRVPVTTTVQVERERTEQVAKTEFVTETFEVEVERQVPVQVPVESHEKTTIVHSHPLEHTHNSFFDDHHGH